MTDDYHSRQSFLGERLPEVLEHTRVAVVGVSGGGSHVVQQGAHVGFQDYTLFEPQDFGMENLHRHVGAWLQDALRRRGKLWIAKRVIRSVWPKARINAIPKRWQDAAEELRSTDIIFSCLDGFRARLDLETTARRYLIPLIDIGLGMVPDKVAGPRMGGHVALSLPGGPCLKCMRVVTERELAEEAAHGGTYPGFGPHPQVVWANGVLASTAMGVALDLLTGWNKLRPPHPCLSYDGNSCLVRPREFGTIASCPHHPLDAVGDPV